MRTSLLLLLAGFTAWTPTQGSAQAAQPVPCTVPVASSPDEQWQQVSAEGFTFCIPGSWRVSGRVVRGDGGSIRWGTGEHRPTRTGTMTRVVRAGSPSPTPPGRSSRFSETIGGHVAELWDNELEGRFYTGAKWQSPAPIYLEGQSTNLRGRDRQLEIYRTVRFTQQ
jgi:hypothetical protein